MDLPRLTEKLKYALAYDIVNDDINKLLLYLRYFPF